jgi:hypothetical protein
MKGMHTVKERDMLATNLDFLLKKMDEESKQQIRAPIQALDSHFMCEVCENGGHSGNDCPETREDCAYLNKNIGFRPQGSQGGASRAHRIREVIITPQISIRTNLP